MSVIPIEGPEGDEISGALRSVDRRALVRLLIFEAAARAVGVVTDLHVPADARSWFRANESELAATLRALDADDPTLLESDLPQVRRLQADYERQANLAAFSGKRVFGLDEWVVAAPDQPDTPIVPVLTDHLLGEVIRPFTILSARTEETGHLRYFDSLPSFEAYLCSQPWAAAMIDMAYNDATVPGGIVDVLRALDHVPARPLLAICRDDVDDLAAMFRLADARRTGPGLAGAVRRPSEIGQALPSIASDGDWWPAGWKRTLERATEFIALLEQRGVRDKAGWRLRHLLVMAAYGHHGPKAARRFFFLSKRWSKQLVAQAGETVSSLPGTAAPGEHTLSLSSVSATLRPWLLPWAEENAALFEANFLGRVTETPRRARVVQTVPGDGEVSRRLPHTPLRGHEATQTEGRTMRKPAVKAALAVMASLAVASSTATITAPAADAHSDGAWTYVYNPITDGDSDHNDVSAWYAWGAAVAPSNHHIVYGGYGYPSDISQDVFARASGRPIVTPIGSRTNNGHAVESKVVSIRLGCRSGVYADGGYVVGVEARDKVTGSVLGLANIMHVASPQVRVGQVLGPWTTIGYTSQFRRNSCYDVGSADGIHVHLEFVQPHRYACYIGHNYNQPLTELTRIGMLGTHNYGGQRARC